MSYKNYRCYRQSLITPIAPITLITKKAALFGATHFIEKLYNKSYFKKTFPPRGSAKSTSTLCARSAASVEAGRRPRKRSLHKVNEHFEDKPDAKKEPC
jgi:hypothetical protein